MKRFLICLQLVLFSLFITPVLADEYVADEGDTGVLANIDTDNFSSIELEEDAVEIEIETDVVITLTDYNGDPISDHSVRIYIEGDDTGVTLIQPSLSGLNGEAIGGIKAENAGMYKVRAVDDTYGYDIEIVSFDIFYTIPLEVPIVFDEPSYTKGTTNTIVWTYEFGYEYFAEVSINSSFDNVLDSSGWVSSSQYTFTDLEDSTMYFFRIKKRNIGEGESDWSDSVYSVQDGISPIITLISIENMDTSSKEADDYIEIQAKIEDNLLLNSQVTYCVLSDDSLFECSSYSSLDGSMYTSRISLSELERDSDGNLLDSYSFCIEATDEAGNISRNCDIEIILKEEEEGSVTEGKDEELKIEDFNVESFTEFPVTLVNYISEMFSLKQILLLSLLIALVSLYIIYSLHLGDFRIPLLFIPLLFLSLLDEKKEYLLEGVVYNSKTKSHIKYPIIKIMRNNGKTLKILIGDIKGRFKINLIGGNVKIRVIKYGYIFPSTIVTDNTDYPLQNVYLGKSMRLRKTQKNIVSIPIDRKVIPLYVKLIEILLIPLSFLLFSIFVLGFFFSIYLIFNDPSLTIFFLFLLYMFEIFLLLRYLIEKCKRYGYVKNEKGKRVEGVDIVVKDSKSMKILKKGVSDEYGRYIFELEKGEYVLDILSKEYEIVAVEEGREFKVEGKERCIKDLIVKEK